jgi:trk system potassium uptake protein TrkA
MNILIVGSGQVGSHTAEALTGAGNAVTLIDSNPERLAEVSDALDVRTFEGNGAVAADLLQAGVAEADLIIAATSVDEVNLIAASIGGALGAKRSIARVHHSAFFGLPELSYDRHFGIDQLICPEYSTSKAIARVLRNPAALEIEQFSGGRIEMHEFAVSDDAPALGVPLSNVQMPSGTRLLAVSHGGEHCVPMADTSVRKGDRVVLVGNTDLFDDARAQFRTEKARRRSIVIMGGTPMAVWLCKALHDRAFSIRLFETNRHRAEELAEKLDWITVLNCDATDKTVFAEEQIGLADVFVGLLDDDEDNIVGAVLAKAGGVNEAMAVVQRARYLDLLYHIGIDRAYSPGISAATEIVNLLDDRPVRPLANLATGLGAVLVRVASGAESGGRALNEIALSPKWVVGAIRRGQRVWVPGASDRIMAGDMLLAVGRPEDQDILNQFLVEA